MTEKLIQKLLPKPDVRLTAATVLFRCNTILYFTTMQHGRFKFGMFITQVRVNDFYAITDPIGFFVFAKSHRAILPIQSVSFVMNGFWLDRF